MSYRRPEEYVRKFVRKFLGELGIRYQEEARPQESPNIFWTDFITDLFIIEAKAPGRRDYGREQLFNYMKKQGCRIGLLIDIPVREYYEEYREPYQGKVGFELYLDNHLLLMRLYERSEINKAYDDLKVYLTITKEVPIAAREPSIVNVLDIVRGLTNRWEGKLLDILRGYHDVKVYRGLWEVSMGLIYGERTLSKINLDELFVKLTIYTAFLKVLGTTLVESMLGGGRYTVLLALASNGSDAAVKLFWERGALVRFNINYLFERDEYDWIFKPTIAQKLNEFFKEIGKSLLGIDWSREVSLDLLKRVYQFIVPKEIRKDLGEFYTPDWIAKLMLWRSLHLLVKGSTPGNVIDSNVDIDLVNLVDEFFNKHGTIPRFIDPTCGSFTFGVHYLNTLVKWYVRKKPNINVVDFLYNYILENVIGIDLNPVAVITSKVNYIIQIHSLLSIVGQYLGEEPLIPIYRIDLTAIHDMIKCDRVSRRALHRFIAGNEFFEYYIPLRVLNIDKASVKAIAEIRCVNGNECFIVIKIPRYVIEIARKQQKLRRAFLALLERGVRGFEEELGTVFSDDMKRFLQDFINIVKVFESKGYNHMWHSNLLNYILTFISIRESFDIVIGNLPWVNVSSYSKEYGNYLKSISKELNVQPPSQGAKKLDISIPLFAIASKYLAKNNGIVSLMVPTSIFRGLHGSRWRDFSTMGLRPVEVFDLEEIKPFEDAENQPGIVIAVKGGVVGGDI